MLNPYFLLIFSLTLHSLSIGSSIGSSDSAATFYALFLPSLCFCFFGKLVCLYMNALSLYSLNNLPSRSIANINTQVWVLGSLGSSNSFILFLFL